MATATSNPSATSVNSPTQSGPAPNQSGTKQGKAVVPTNHVTTKDGATVRARIDPTLTVEDVIRQLCLNLKLKDPPPMFSLRDDDDTLVTTENLSKMIKSRANLKCVRALFSCGTRACIIYAIPSSLFHRLVNSSVIEAAETIEKLNLREEKNLKLALFSLQKFIKVE